PPARTRGDGRGGRPDRGHQPGAVAARVGRAPPAGLLLHETESGGQCPPYLAVADSRFPNVQNHSTRVSVRPSAFSTFLHSLGVPLTSTASAACLSIATSCIESP